MLPKSEQIGHDNHKEGDHIKVYIADVKTSEKGPRAIISRSHQDLVKRLFEQEVPEIFDGVVEIKSVSREAGSRTKMAVVSKTPDIAAVGACIGTKGARVNSIVDELGGEKIDIIEYSDDPQKYISAALSPAKELSVEITDLENKNCRVTVPDGQLSLARVRMPALPQDLQAGRLTFVPKAVSSEKMKRTKNSKLPKIQQQKIHLSLTIQRKRIQRHSTLTARKLPRLMLRLTRIQTKNNFI